MRVTFANKFYHESPDLTHFNDWLICVDVPTQSGVVMAGYTKKFLPLVRVRACLGQTVTINDSCFHVNSEAQGLYL